MANNSIENNTIKNSEINQTINMFFGFQDLPPEAIKQLKEMYPDEFKNSKGNDIYNKLVEKSNKLLEDSKIEIEDNKNQLLIETKKLTENNATSDEIYLKTTELNNNITEAYKKLELAEKINKEVQKMKFGSIAIINQIRVISKQRIYDPKTEFDILSGIKLSNENLNLIDDKMKKMFIKN